MLLFMKLEHGFRRNLFEKGEIVSEHGFRNCLRHSYSCMLTVHSSHLNRQFTGQG